MSKFSEFFFSSNEPWQMIHVKRCDPDGEPRAVIQIAHGIAEHAERYADFMEFLADNGFVVVANDHLGHGKTVTKEEDKGFFSREDGWNTVVKDMDKLRDIMHREFPNIPYVFFGHSMGSFLTRTYLIQYPDKYDAAIISGTGHQSKLLAASGYAMACLFSKKNGEKSTGNELNGIAFGAYNKGFQPQRTVFDWLSRDNAAVDEYIRDPMCGFVATNGLFRDMMGGILFMIKQENIDKMSKTQPIYFMSGACDPVGENGKGVERAYKAFCQAGLKDVFMRLYPEGRHEMLNELNKEQVYQDILNWLNEKL